ncbi:MAG: hypothetical protein NTW26_09020 [bacterium]|nr:hypothetical protein [bacterium]
MPFTAKSRLILAVLALLLVGPIVVDNVRAQYTDLTEEQIEALKQAWHVTNARQDGTSWTTTDYNDDDWSTAVLGTFSEGLSAARSQVYGWPGADAEWIWARSGVTAYFRREFGLPRSLINDEDKDIQEHFIVRITANNNYQFYVNGVLVHQDSTENEDDWTTYEQIDVTEYLDVGDNVFAVEAVNTDDPERRRGGTRDIRAENGAVPDVLHPAHGSRIR